MTSNEKVLCVAPFPPPVHGFSIASLNLVNELNKKYTTYRYDVSSKFNIFKYLVASFVIIKFSISKGKNCPWVVTEEWVKFILFFLLLSQGLLILMLHFIITHIVILITIHQLCAL